MDEIHREVHAHHHGPHHGHAETHHAWLSAAVGLALALALALACAGSHNVTVPSSEPSAEQPLPYELEEQFCRARNHDAENMLGCGIFFLYFRQGHYQVAATTARQYLLEPKGWRGLVIAKEYERLVAEEEVERAAELLSAFDYATSSTLHPNAE